MKLTADIFADILRGHTSNHSLYVNTRHYFMQQYELMVYWMKDALDNAGLGVHIRHLTQDTVSQYQKVCLALLSRGKVKFLTAFSDQLLLAASCLFVTGVGLARLSHLIFFHRLMAAKHWLRYFLLLMMAFIISGSFALICCFVFACRPVSKAWDVAISGRCMDRPAIFLAVAVSNIVSDLCLIALPVPLISGLHLSLSQKVRFAILFSLVCVLVDSPFRTAHSYIAFRTFVASAIRLRLTIPLLGSEDLTYAMAPVALLVYVRSLSSTGRSRMTYGKLNRGVESNLIIIAASLPAMRQLCHLVSSRLSLAEGLSTEPNARRWSAGL
jgi:hypothetical protein